MSSFSSDDKNAISPNLPTMLNPSTCVKKGLCPVTTRKGRNFDLYFEQHGRGNQFKVLLIMGLNASLNCWIKQVEWFGGGKAFQSDKEREGGEEEKSTVLVYDNRGVGNSGYPKEFYT
jgi:pimeloyl-ACP methyl ester carboxylesterase